MYALSKYLAGVLKNLCGKAEFTVCNSADFVKCISDLKVDDTEEMVSFDMKALYTSLPLTSTMMLCVNVGKKTTLGRIALHFSLATLWNC